MIKKLVLLGSLVGTGLIFLGRNSVELNLCLDTDTSCRLFFYNLGEVSYFFPLILVFSLITYFLPLSVFKSWLKFSLVWVPIVLISTTFVHLQWHHTGGGFLGLDDIFDVPIIFTMYGVYILGSIISIARGYNSRK